MPEQAYSDKIIRDLVKIFASTGKEIVYDDKEDVTNNSQPIIARGDTYGNENEKVSISRLQDSLRKFSLQTAFVPRFSKIGSVFPFSSNGGIADGYNNSGFVSFLRFGEKQLFDTFLNCTKNDFGKFPISFLNTISRGATIDASNKYNYRGLYYLISTYLESMPNVHLGSISNNGGTSSSFQLNGKTSLQVPTVESDGVFALNEGTPLSSGFYRNNAAHSLELNNTDAWKDESGNDLVDIEWERKIEKIKHDSTKSDGFCYHILDGYKGWLSFWLDLSGTDPSLNDHNVMDFQQYAEAAPIPNGDPWNLLLTFGTFTAVTSLGSRRGRLTNVTGGGNIYASYLLSQRYSGSGSAFIEVTVVLDQTNRQIEWVLRNNILTNSIITFSAAGQIIVRDVTGFKGLQAYIANTKYIIRIDIIDNFRFDVIINGTRYDNGGSHYTSELSFSGDDAILFGNIVPSIYTIRIDDIRVSWMLGDGVEFQVSESRLYLDDTIARFFVEFDSLYGTDSRLFYGGIDWSKPHRITIRWDFIDQSDPIRTIQLDDYTPRDYFPYEDGGSGFANGYAMNALIFPIEFLGLKIYGIVQSGDFFPFCDAESNKQYLNPFNLNLMEGISGVLGPYRRDTDGYKNLFATQEEIEDFESYNDGDIIYNVSVDWTGSGDNGTDVLVRVVELDETMDAWILNPNGKVLRILDLNNGVLAEASRSVTPSTVGRIITRFYLVERAPGGTKEQRYGLFEGANRIGEVRVSFPSNNVDIYNGAAFVASGLSVIDDVVNCIELEWTTDDKDGAPATHDYRVWVNGVPSSWYATDNNMVGGVDRIRYVSLIPSDQVDFYIDDITYIYQGSDFVSGKEPALSYPEGEWLNLQWIQKGVGSCRHPYVRFMDSADDGFLLKLRSNLNDNAIEHDVDEIENLMENLETNYRYIDTTPADQFINGNVPQSWLPAMVSMQTHPKYPDLEIINGWYDRYVYCNSKFASTIVSLESMLTSNRDYENLADLQYTPLTHPFIHPNNSALYYADNVAMPEKFSRPPQRMRKEVLSVEETFFFGKEGDSVYNSPYWASIGAPPANITFTLRKFQGKLQAFCDDNNNAAQLQAEYTIPTPSPTIPGNYTIEYEVYIKDLPGDNEWFQFFVGDAAAGNRITMNFNNVTGNIELPGGNNIGAWSADTIYTIIIEIWDPNTFAVYKNGVYYDNGGAGFPVVAAFTGPITRCQIYSHSSREPEFYLNYIDFGWKLYPDVDDDDFIIYPTYLGHARPIEVTGLEDKWGFRDYGKYTSIPNTHPTKFWVSFFLSTPWGNSEQNGGEIILYDVAGNEILYLLVDSLRSSDLGNYPKVMKYASDSGETTTALTTIDGSWNGWLPVTIEVDTDNSYANIYFHCKLVAGGISLNGSLEGFGKIVFLHSALTLPAGASGIWRQEDFQGFGQGVSINGVSAAGGTWVLTAAGTATVTGQWFDGNSWMFFDDNDAANVLSDELTFTVSSPATPSSSNRYAIKYKKEIISLTNNGFATRIYNTAPANGEIDFQIRAGGALWNDAGAGYVNTTLTVPVNQEFELIVDILDANNFNIYIDGVLLTTTSLGVKTAWTGTVDKMIFETLANADDASFYCDNIDINWLPFGESAGSYHPFPGSLMIDGIQWSCDDGEFKQFRKNQRCTFTLPYRDYENPHHSSFHNNLNSPDEDIIPLPPYSGVPAAGYNHASWTDGSYWDFYSSGESGQYAGAVANWYLWRFPYVFGGQFDNGVDVNLRSLARLEHSVSNDDREYYGKWEISLAGVVDDPGAGGDGEVVITFDHTDTGDYRLDNIQSTNYMIRILNNGNGYEIRIMDDAFPVVVLEDSKEIHKYTIDWTEGFIWLYIDGRLVDGREYAGGAQFYLQHLRIHTAVTNSDSRVYAVVFGAQCSNESDFKAGILDAIPGGTMELEGATGHLLSRNDGTYFLENQKDNWSWEKKHHWKKLVLDANSLPDSGNARNINDLLIEYGKDSGGDRYSLLHDPVNIYYKLHTGAQVGPVNSNLETYGKFFSLFLNDFTFNRLNTRMNLFDVYTFTNGYTSSFFEMSVIGLEGSWAKWLAVYAAQFSQIADEARNIEKSYLVKNKTGYDLLLAFDQFGIPMPIDLGEDKTRTLVELLVRRNSPKISTLLNWLSILYGIEEEYVSISESRNESQVSIQVPYPQANGVFNQVGWRRYLEDVVNKLKAAGVTYIYETILFAKSDNASGVWDEAYDQVNII
jgi:hypothetical protein